MKKQTNNTTLDDVINAAYSESNIAEVKSGKSTKNEATNNDIDNESKNEFKDMLQNAIPVKTEILTENANAMNEIKRDFSELITDKLNAAKDKKLKAYYNKVFKNINDYLYFKGGYPNENSKGKGEKLAETLIMIIPWLKYLGELDIIQQYLNDYGISINVAKNLEDTPDFEFLKDEGMKNTIKGYFLEGHDVQEKVCQNNDMIKKDFYENLPDSYKYDKHENPGGLKAAQFNKLVNVITKMQIDADKKDELQNNELYKLDCLNQSTDLMKETLIENS